MSLAGRLRAQGTLATVYRPTAVRDADGSTRAAAWAIAGDVRLIVDGVASDVATRVFGDDVRVELRAFALLSADVLPDDGITLASGPLAGQRFRVTGRALALGRARAEHAELALVATTEAFDA